MISEHTAHKGINILFHMLILCIFLTVLFFTYISKKEEKVINKEFTNAINTNIPKIFDSIDNFGKEISPKVKINWNDISKFSNKISNKYKGKDPEVVNNNKKILLKAVIMCISLAVITILSILYFGLYKGYNLDLKSILLENLVLAILIGIIEVLFFSYIASVYIPVNTSQLTDDLIDRIEYNINKY